MEVANLSLCKKLYELSGWQNDTTWWCWVEAHQDYEINDGRPKFPAYSLGFLMRELPAKHQMLEGDIVELTIRKEDNVAPKGVRYLAYYAASVDSDCWCQIADTPEDCAAKLAIELFTQGILKKGEE